MSKVARRRVVASESAGRKAAGRAQDDALAAEWDAASRETRAMMDRSGGVRSEKLDACAKASRASCTAYRSGKSGDHRRAAAAHELAADLESSDVSRRAHKKTAAEHAAHAEATSRKRS